MLLEKFESDHKEAKVLVLFGGSPVRRDEVIQSLKNIDGLSIFGTLGEEEGLEVIRSHKKVDIVLIGGRYTDEQRARIRHIIKSEFPHIKLTEPGVDYRYSEENILNTVKALV